VITREMVQERLNQLKAEMVQMQANLHAYEGAVQDCEHWLAVLAEKETQEPEVQNAI
jgi:hypothetical protein